MNDVPETLNFSQIYHGMIGRDFIESFNGNFNICDEKFIYILGQMIYMVKSSDIKEFKLQDGVVQYTLDTEEPKTWTPVDITKWGNIKGSLADQLDLKEALDSKAAAETVATLQNLVSTINSNLTNLTGLVDTANANINKNTNSINDILTTLNTKVTSTTVKELRLLDGVFQWSPDGLNWYQQEAVKSLNWGSMTGDIEQQTDLYQIISELRNGISTLNQSISSLTGSVNTLTSNVSSLQSTVNNLSPEVESLKTAMTSLNNAVKKLETDKANASDLSSHVNNFENPHNVTKAQIGLENVDNTADVDKPITEPQKEYIEEQLTQLQVNLNTTNLLYNFNQGNKILNIGLMDSNTYYNNLHLLSNSIAIVDDTYVPNEDVVISQANISGTSGSANIGDSNMSVTVEEVSE